MHPFASSTHLACPDCDAVYEAPIVAVGEEVLCARCGTVLFIRRKNSLIRASALAVAAAIFFVLTNCFPFMSLRADFRESTMSLWQSAVGLETQGYPFLSVAVALFILFVPGLIIAGLLYLLLPLLGRRRWRGAVQLLRWLRQARRWNMIEVYLLAALVSLVKLQKLAIVTLGASFWMFTGLIVCLMAAVTVIDYREIWARLERAT